MNSDINIVNCLCAKLVICPCVHFTITEKSSNTVAVMGAAAAVFNRNVTFSISIDEKDLAKDPRRRNSLAFYISEFVQYEDEDYEPLVEIVRNDKFAKFGGKTPNVRHSSKYFINSSPHCSNRLLRTAQSSAILQRAFCKAI